MHGGQVGAAREHRQPGEHLLLGLGQQPVRPVDRGGQALVPGLGVPRAAGQQVRVPQPVRDLRRAHRPGPGGGQLDRQRQPVQATTDVGHHASGGRRVGDVGPVRSGPIDEQDGRLLDRQRRHRPDLLAADSQHLPAGRQHRDPGAVRDDRLGQPGGVVEHVLAVVQHQQQLPPAQILDHGLLDRQPVPATDPQRRRHGVADRAAVRQGCQFTPPHPVGEPGRLVPGDLLGQPGLADPARPGQRDQRRPAERRRHQRDLVAPPDEAGLPARQVGRRPDRGEGRVLFEQLLVRLPGRRGRLDAELVGQEPAQVPVDLERVGLAAGQVEGAHQQDGQAFPLGEPADQDLQLDDDVAGATQPQQGLGPLLPGRQPQLLQPGHLRLYVQGGRLEVGQYGPAPQSQSGVQQLRGPVVVPGGRPLAGLGDEPLEPCGVQLVRRGREPVAGGLEPQPGGVAGATQHRPQPGDVGPQSGEGIGGRVVAPHGGDQPVDRDHGVPMQQQHGQQGTRLGAADRDGSPAGRDLERSQDPELHRGPHSGRRLGTAATRLQPAAARVTPRTQEAG